MHCHSPSKPKKFKWTFSSRKCMATVFWNRKGVLLVECMERGTTITAASYCITLERLWRAIQNKRRGMSSSGIVFLHDNARPHTAAATKKLLQSFRWDVFDHPPYSPVLGSLRFPSFCSHETLARRTEVWLRERAADQHRALAESTGGCLLWQGYWKVGTTLWQISQSERRLCREVAGRCI